MLSVDIKHVVEVAAVALLIAMLSQLQLRYRLLQYLFFLRVPLLHAVLLLLLPLAVTTRAFGNLFVLTPFQLAAVTFLLLFSTWAVMHTWGLVFVGAAPRFRVRFRQPDGREPYEWDKDPRPNKLIALLAAPRRRAYIVPFVLAAPALVVAYVCSPPPASQKALAIAGGLGLAIALRELGVWCGQKFRHWLYQPRPAMPAARFLYLPRLLRQGGYRLADTHIGRAFAVAFSRGYSTLSDGDPATTRTPLEESEGAYSHWRALGFVALALMVYVVGAFVLDPIRQGLLVEQTPALAYVLLVMTLLGLVLAAVTFFIDFYRVPLLVLLVAVLFLSYRYSDLDHYYDFSTAYHGGGALPQPLTAQEVVEKWNGRHAVSSHPVMVIVAASGGGSHAARWTTEVLSRLREDDRLGSRFFESIAFVSAVSGGALGAMYALDVFKAGPPTTEALVRARDAASRSNVGALAWGLAYPDLLRKAAPSLSFARRDRGWALEQNWRSALTGSSEATTLASWAEQARLAEKPAVVFNATIMETGKRLLLSRVTIPGAAAEQFATLYASHDLSVATAVRLSAAFPYLSPMARPFSPYPEGSKHAEDFERHAFHVADGGYYDSSGTLTAVEFLKAILPAYRTLGRTKILLVELRTALDEPAAAATRHNWLQGLAGPTATAYKVSMSSQAARATLELDLLADRWNNVDLPQNMRVEIKPVVFRLRDTGTLPWHLSQSEKNRISSTWTHEENQSALTELVKFFGASP